MNDATAIENARKLRERAHKAAEGLAEVPMETTRGLMREDADKMVTIFQAVYTGNFAPIAGDYNPKNNTHVDSFQTQKLPLVQIREWDNGTSATIFLNGTTSELLEAAFNALTPVADTLAPKKKAKRTVKPKAVKTEIAHEAAALA